MAAFSMGGGGSQPVIQWMWMDDGNRWEYYDQADSDRIELAYMTGQAGAVVTSAVGGRARRGATYSVLFPTMKQVNTVSNFTRSVKRSVGGNFIMSEGWQWLVGASWESVPLWVCVQIVASRDVRREASTRAHLPGGEFEFNLSLMVAIQRPSGHQRSLRIVPGGPFSSAAGVGTTVVAQLAAAVAASGGGGGWPPAQGARGAQGAQGSQNANGSREAEYRQLVDTAQDCTATVAADETCAVCLDGFTSRRPALLLGKCVGHYMHRACIMNTFRALGPKCPTCSVMYAQLTGTQPDGTMTVSTRPRGSLPLSGHASVGTIVINYNFPDGIQDQRHPNVGQRYRGTSRVAYLPDTREGREVLQLLRVCFDRKMTFTVGTSITTGISNCVVWNGVHHKTSTSGGSASFGYPDGGYLTRVKEELAAKGIR